MQETYWNKLEKLHGLLLQAGAIVEQIHLHPDSLKALSEEMYPKERTVDGVPQTEVPLITGANTMSGGLVKIVSDPLGVKL